MLYLLKNNNDYKVIKEYLELYIDEDEILN